MTTKAKRFSDWPEDVAEKLDADEKEREFRDKRVAKFCPVCGRRPEEVIDKSGRHIYNGFCEKCQIRFVIHIC
jgi:hypothetical protein